MIKTSDCQHIRVINWSVIIIMRQNIHCCIHDVYKRSITNIISLSLFVLDFVLDFKELMPRHG